MKAVAKARTAASVLGGYSSFPPPSPGGARAPARPTAHGERRQGQKGAISRTIALPATLRPHEQAVLYAKVAGYLKTIASTKRLRPRRRAPRVDRVAGARGRPGAAEGRGRGGRCRVSARQRAQKKVPDLVMPRPWTTPRASSTWPRRTSSGRRRAGLHQDPLPTVRHRDEALGRSGAFIPSATSGSVPRAPHS